jgi:hypothetical protein
MMHMARDPDELPKLARALAADRVLLDTSLLVAASVEEERRARGQRSTPVPVKAIGG